MTHSQSMYSASDGILEFPPGGPELQSALEAKYVDTLMQSDCSSLQFRDQNYRRTQLKTTKAKDN